MLLLDRRKRMVVVQGSQSFALPTHRVASPSADDSCRGRQAHQYGRGKSRRFDCEIELTVIDSKFGSLTHENFCTAI